MCVWAVFHLPTCASDIRVLHLITGTDGSINRTSVCAADVYPGQVSGSVCVCDSVSVSRPFYVPVCFHRSLFPPCSVCSSQLESDCLDINFIVVSNSL